MEYVQGSTDTGHLRMYAFHGVAKERMDVLLNLLRDPSNILFGCEGNIPLFESIMKEFFPGLTLKMESVDGGPGYDGFFRSDHAVISTHAALHQNIPTDLELRLYPQEKEEMIRIGLFPKAYACGPIDDIVVLLAENPSYAVRDIEYGSFPREKVITAADEIPKVLAYYTQARNLFGSAIQILTNEGLRERDLETLYNDKESHGNRVIRRQSAIEYASLLERLVQKGKNS